MVVVQVRLERLHAQAARRERPDAVLLVLIDEGSPEKRIVAGPALRKDLFDQLLDGDIVIEPSFQRRVVDASNQLPPRRHFCEVRADDQRVGERSDRSLQPRPVTICDGTTDYKRLPTT